jgi:hypothetical protein
VDELENALAAALRREGAPERFAEQVLSRANACTVPAAPWWRVPVVRWSAAATVAVACIAEGVSLHERQQRIRGEEARQQVLMALRITGSKLRGVQEQLARRDDKEGDRR